MTLAATCQAQEPDRIRSVLSALNQARAQHDSKAFAQLFTSDGELLIGGQVVATGPAGIENALRQPAEIWTETFSAGIEIGSIRFLSRNVAVVDAVQNQFGSLILKQSVPVTVWLKRSGKNWRIASLQLHSVLNGLGRYPAF
jgi:uncharacterized protein (TIGR02246 family)